LDHGHAPRFHGDLLDMPLEPAPGLAYGQPDRIYDDVPELPHLSVMGQRYLLAHRHNDELLVVPPVGQAIDSHG